MHLCVQKGQAICLNMIQFTFYYGFTFFSVSYYYQRAIFEKSSQNYVTMWCLIKLQKPKITSMTVCQSVTGTSAAYQPMTIQTISNLFRS